MSDRFKDLPEREQRIEMMRRNGEDFRDDEGNWCVALGTGQASGLVRAIWADDDADDEPALQPEPDQRSPAPPLAE